MTIEEKTVYFTTDGQWFENMEEAAIHEAVLEIAGHLHTTLGIKIELCKSIAIELLDNYTIISKSDPLDEKSS